MQTSYFETGGKIVEGEILDDNRVGEWKWYFETGELETIITFENGKKTGVQPFFNELGEKTKEEIYENGVFISETVLVEL